MLLHAKSFIRWMQIRRTINRKYIYNCDRRAIKHDARVYTVRQKRGASFSLHCCSVHVLAKLHNVQSHAGCEEC